LASLASIVRRQAERPYPKMLPPLSQHLMDRNAAIVLARSAARGVHQRMRLFGADAQRLNSGQRYEHFVGHAAVDASIDFWRRRSPKQQGICLNPAAVRSILPIFRKLT
jgi:hypothetical protein